MTRRRLLLGLGILIAGIAVVVTLARFADILLRFERVSPPPVLTGPNASGSGIGDIVPPNAFLQHASDSLAWTADSNFVYPSPLVPNARPIQKLSIPQIQKKVEQFPSTIPSQGPIQLPRVADNEIAIDSKGAASVYDFLTYYSSHINEVQVKDRGLQSVIKDENKAPLLPFRLVEKVINGETGAELRQSLLAYKDMVSPKIEYIRQIKVTGLAIEASKNMIGLEKLNGDLLDKALGVLAGTYSRGELKTFFDSMQSTALGVNKSFVSALGLVKKPSQNPFSSAMEEVLITVGLEKKAMAQGLAFGGPVVFMFPCTCDVSMLLYFGPPVPPLPALYVSYVWLATPALFPYKGAHIGAYWLGTYVPGTIPCMIYAGLTCASAGVGVLPVIAGTSP